MPHKNSSIPCGRGGGDPGFAVRRARLHDAIERGYDDLAAGRVFTLDDHDQIDAFFVDL